MTHSERLTQLETEIKTFSNTIKEKDIKISELESELTKHTESVDNTAISNRIQKLENTLKDIY